MNGATSTAIVQSSTPWLVNFFVPGLPIPGGSKRAFRNKYTDRIQLVDSSGQRGKDWRAAVRIVASGSVPKPLDEPLCLSLVFVLPRPKAHFLTHGRLRLSAPKWHAKRPDLTKLVRSVEDSLTDVLWRDDAQIAQQAVCKVYGDVPGVRVSVRPMEPL